MLSNLGWWSAGRVFERFAPAVALLGLLALLLRMPAARADGSSAGDNSDDNVINPPLWVAVSEGSPTPVKLDHRLQIAIPSTSHGSSAVSEQGFRTGYMTVAPPSGDFYVQVGLELLNWPSDDGIRLGIALAQNPSQLVSDWRLAMIHSIINATSAEDNGDSKE